MGRFFGWKLRKHINIPNFYSGQYHQTIFHDTYFSDCIFSFICWQKSSILRISSKKFLSSKVFEDFSKFRRIFVFVFGLFSEPEDSSSSSSVHFWSSLQHCWRMGCISWIEFGLTFSDNRPEYCSDFPGYLLSSNRTYSVSDCCSSWVWQVSLSYHCPWQN